MTKKFSMPTMSKSFVVGVLGLMVVLTGAHASNYNPLVQRGSSGFNTKFEPSSPLLAISDGEVILPSVVGEAFQLQWRVFIPPGTKTLQMTMYTFASPPETKVLMKFGSPPSGSALNVTPENAAAVDITRVVQTLTANGGGVELPFSAPASAGALKLSSRSGELTQTILTNTGGWVYINALQVPGNRIYELNTSVTVDESCYRTWFAGAQWDASGNPAEDVTHTCSGSSGGTPLTGITLSANSLVKGSSNAITITPTPSNASLSSCVPVYGGGVSNLVSISGGKISLAGGSNSITTTQSVTIQCGAASAAMTIEPSEVALTGIALSASSLAESSSGTVVISPKPANAVLPTCTVGNMFGPSSQVKVAGNVISNDLTSSVITENLNLTVSCGSHTAALLLTSPIKVVEGGDATHMTLGIDLIPTSTELGLPGKVWIAARLPASGFFFPNDMWFFRTETDWKTVLTLPNPDSFKFKDIAVLTERQVISVDLGISKSDLQGFGVEIFMGYRTTTGAFKSLGKVWP